MLVFVLSACEIHIDERPNFDDRNKLVGNYRIEEYSDTFGEITEYSISIGKSRIDNKAIYISNFYGVGIEVKAEVRGNRIIIPYQVINGYEIDGEGWYDYGEIEFDYVVTDLQRHRLLSDYCSAVAW